MLLYMLFPLPNALLPAVRLVNSYSTSSAQLKSRAFVGSLLWAFVAFTVLYCHTLGWDAAGGEDRSSWFFICSVLTWYLP